MKQYILSGLLMVLSFASVHNSYAKKRSSSYYQVIVYHFKTAEQEQVLDAYLKDAYISAMHKKGINNIGVFKAVANDTASDKLIYVIQSFKDLKKLASVADELLNDQEYIQAAASYLNADYKNSPYTRMENIVLRSFELAPMMTIPQLSSPKKDRVYELRSYESATEKIYRNKVQMFNQGGEVALFARLNFNAVFYGEVIAGSHMPNLMYMTSFENKAERDAHWKSFSADPEWKKLSALPEYQNNVSHIDITFLRATDYSDL